MRSSSLSLRLAESLASSLSAGPSPRHDLYLAFWERRFCARRQRHLEGVKHATDGVVVPSLENRVTIAVTITFTVAVRVRVRASWLFAPCCEDNIHGAALPDEVHERGVRRVADLSGLGLGLALRLGLGVGVGLALREPSPAAPA